MFTSYGQAHTTFPGDASFESLWAFLNERAAVVHLHPTTPSSTMLAVGGDSRRALAPPAIDHTHETTRAACDLIYSGTKGAHPDVAIILSHAGGTLPFIAQAPASHGARQARHHPECGILTPLWCATAGCLQWAPSAGIRLSNLCSPRALRSGGPGGVHGAGAQLLFRHRPLRRSTPMQVGGMNRPALAAPLSAPLPAPHHCPPRLHRPPLPFRIV